MSGSQNRKRMLGSMLHNTMQILKNYPRSFWLLSFLQFGILYACHGMLLFFPEIIHQVSQYDGNNLQICKIIETVIENKNNATSILSKECVEELDISAYINLIILESCYLVGFIIISLTVNYIGRLPILVFFFMTCGLCGILIVFINNSMIATYFYVWFLVIGINSNLINTVAYDLFPTNLRSMAISTTMVFGRLGGLIGGNTSSLLLELSCNSTFIIGGVIIIVCGILTFFIPNIYQRKGRD